VALDEQLTRIAAAAASFAGPGEEVSGVLVAEPLGQLVFLCAYASADGHAWLLLDGDGRPVVDKRLVREAASLAALCEIAEESAGGGDLPELRTRLAELRETEAPEGIEEAEEAAAALAGAIASGPRVASSDYLDEIGTASRRLEQALGEDARSPFTAAMQSALSAVEELIDDVERNYKGPLA
jgi:hypothetical protein